MSKHVVVTNGDDPLTKPIVDYLFRTYGMTAEDIWRLQLDSQVSEVQLVTVSLMVRKEDLHG